VKNGKDKTGYMPFQKRGKTRKTNTRQGRFSCSRTVSCDDKNRPMAYAWLSIGRMRRSGPSQGERTMTLDLVVLNPLIALIAGILILLVPRLLNFVVAIYLIVIGILGLVPHFQ
jgi:Protein of unknown function (DUF3096)